MSGPVIPITGYKQKQEMKDAAQAATDAVKAQKKTLNDREYDLKRAQEQADWTDIAAGGADACRDEALQARAEAAAKASAAKATGLAKEEVRKLNGEAKKAEAKAKLLEDLAAKTDLERQEAIEAAQAKIAEAAPKVQEAKDLLAQKTQQAQDLIDAATAFPDLDPAWAKNHADPNRSIRALEADLRAMQAELSRLGTNAPPGAVAYCGSLEKHLDSIAHRVKCPRCNEDHGLDRAKKAKDLVMELFKNLEQLGALADDSGLSPQQILDRSIATGMNKLKDAGAGKMLGVLICEDGTILRAFSGDSNGQDDVPGWSQHIPPDGGTMTTANGVKVPLTALPAVDGTPHGVCAAPKLIQEAYRLGKVPLALAEVWYGGGNVQPHGALVASCSTCRKNLDVQLCDQYPTT